MEVIYTLKFTRTGGWGWGWGVEEAEYGLTTEQPEYWLYFLDWR